MLFIYIDVCMYVSAYVPEVFWGLKGERSRGIIGKVKRNEKRELDLRPMGERNDILC